MNHCQLKFIGHLSSYILYLGYPRNSFLLCDSVFTNILSKITENKSEINGRKKNFPRNLQIP